MDPQPTPYPDLNQVLHQLLTRMDGVLGANLLGLYLQGSFAVGDFDRDSDVDFIAVVQDPINDHQLVALMDMHRRLFRLESGWAQHLEGSYFPVAILRDYHRRDELLWYIDNGSNELEQSGHCNTIVVRWTLRHHGIILTGAPAATLVDPIPVEELRREIAADMVEWGRQILAEQDRYNNRFYQGFIVLSYCRMLHDLQAGDVSSKRAAAEWAKQELDPAWHGLIDRTWRTRPDPAVSVRTPADPADFQATLDFMQYVIDLCRQFSQSEPDSK